MTNSEKTPEDYSELSGQMEQLIQNSSVQSHISSKASALFRGERNDFKFNKKIDDIDELADELFDALYDHTNK